MWEMDKMGKNTKIDFWEWHCIICRIQEAKWATPDDILAQHRLVSQRHYEWVKQMDYSKAVRDRHRMRTHSCWSHLQPEEMTPERRAEIESLIR